MSAMVVAVVAVAWTCLGGAVVNVLWLRTFRRHVARWRDHCERCERETAESLRRMHEVARDALELNERYCAFLADKIVVEDPLSRRSARETPRG